MALRESRSEQNGKETELIWNKVLWVSLEPQGNLQNSKNTLDTKEERINANQNKPTNQINLRNNLKLFILVNIHVQSEKKETWMGVFTSSRNQTPTRQELGNINYQETKSNFILDTLNNFQYQLSTSTTEVKTNRQQDTWIFQNENFVT